MEIYNENEETIVKRLLETMTPYIINKENTSLYQREPEVTLLITYIYPTNVMVTFSPKRGSILM